MKKLGIVLLVFIFTALVVTSAMAGYKAPKELCFSGDFGFFSLGFKKLTKIKGSNAKKTYYAVHGEWDATNPLTGTAYIQIRNPNILEAQFSGMYFDSFADMYQLIWDLDTDSGTLYNINLAPGAAITGGNAEVTIHNCDESPWPLDTTPPTE